VTAPPHRKLTVSPEGDIAVNSFSSCRLVALSEMEQLALIEMIKSHLLALIVINRRNLIDMVVARMEIIGKDLLLHLANDPS
jgi:hypothetical protein